MKIVTIDEDLAERTGLARGEEWLSVQGFPLTEGAEAPLCRTEYYINRAFAAVGRLLQRHTGPIFPLIEDLFGLTINPHPGSRFRHAMMMRRVRG